MYIRLLFAFWVRAHSVISFSVLNFDLTAWGFHQRDFRLQGIRWRMPWLDGPGQSGALMSAI